jgi:tetratricopeptide (TPR) repeat protein
MLSTEEKNSRDLRAGMQSHMSGELDRAEKLYRKVTERTARHAGAWYLLGEIAFARGDMLRAEQLVARSLAADSRFAAAHLLNGNVASHRGDIAGAIAAWRAVLALEPSNVAAHVNLGLALPGRGDAAGAEVHARTAIQSDPNSVRAHYALGCALVAQGRLYDAEEPLTRALAQECANVVVMRELASVFAQTYRLKESLSLLDHALSLSPQDPESHHARGNTLQNLQRYDEAEQAFREALRLGKCQPMLLCDLGTTLRGLGRFDEAISCFKEASTISPGFAAAQRGLLETGGLGLPEGDLAGLREVTEDAQAQICEKISAHFALGRVLEKQADYREALQHFQEAGNLQSALLEADGIRFDADLFDRGAEEILAGHALQEFRVPEIQLPFVPVFIVGTPRSGSTLVEQIAASHGDVFSMGEAPDIPHLAGALRHAGEDEAKRKRANDIAVAYAERLRSAAGAAKVVIDKQLDNAFHLGVISKYFPQARIVYCRRDWRDAGLSCLMQAFPGVIGEYTSLDSIRHRGQTLARVMERWREILSLPLLDMHYEAMVEDQEGQARRLIDFLGLPWDPSCLAFHKQSSTVMTASAWQVRQPIYKQSVARWRHYADFLPPEWRQG